MCRASHPLQLRPLALPIDFPPIEVSFRLRCLAYRGHLDLLSLSHVFLFLAMHQSHQDAFAPVVGPEHAQTSPAPSISFLAWFSGESVYSLALQYVANMVG